MKGRNLGPSQKVILMAVFEVLAEIGLLAAIVYVFGIAPPWYIKFWSIVAFVGCNIMMIIALIRKMQTAGIKLVLPEKKNKKD